MATNWQNGIAIAAFVYLTVEFILIKGFGKKAFMLSALKWLAGMLASNREIKTLFQKQGEAMTGQQELIYSVLVKLESIENEVRFNGGKYKLVDAVKDILNNQAVQSSEREAAMYIDPQPMFKTDTAGRVTFVNAAWLDMVGCTDEEEVMGFGFLIVVPEENRDLVEKTAERFAKSPAPFHGRFVYKNLQTGKLVQTNVRTQLIRDQKNNFVGTLGTVTILNP